MGDVGDGGGKLVVFGEIFGDGVGVGRGVEVYYVEGKYGDGEMSLEKLKEYLEEDIKRNQIIQNWQPGRYLEGEYMKWIANKQLKAFYEELKK